MKQTFTQNDLLRYIYSETSLNETKEIRQAIAEDAILRNEYDSLLEGYQMLPKVKFQASRSALQNIMDYSAISQIEYSL